MKCKVCGAESGQYVLCRECNEKKNKGEIIKCKICNEWHYKDKPCKIKGPRDRDVLRTLKIFQKVF